MPWLEGAEEALPPPRRSEPAGLRADILDELADHLALAAEREREREFEEKIDSDSDSESDTDTDSGMKKGEDAVWDRVLQRFGDPNALARRLWWDAMRETIMRE